MIKHAINNIGVILFWGIYFTRKIGGEEELIGN